MSGSTDRSLALFEACFQGDSAKVASLLEGPGADELLREAAGGVTLLHAAVLGGAAAALPLLVAGGAPPDAEIPWEWPAQSPPQVAPAAAAFLQSSGYNCDECDAGCTALNLAVRMRDGAAVEQLLQLGARPDAGFDDWGTALCALHSLVNLFAGDGEGVFESVIHPFLRRGLDPLAPEFAGVFYSGSLFRSCYHPELQQQLLAYLEGQHAAGQLQIASKEAAAELVCGCCQAGRWDHPLVAAGIAAVEATFGAGAAPDSPDDHVLVDLLFRLVDSPQPAPLAALLSTSLPLPLHLRSNHSSWAVREPFPDVSVSLLVRAALSKTAHKDNWRLLQQAGTPVTADDLYNCIDELSSTGVRAVLACRLPAVDTSQPVSTPQRHASLPRYSCPIHRTLHALTQAPWDASRSAIVILEWLRWAGYRPCTWRNATMPAFLQPSERQRVLPVLDPFDLYSPQRSAALGLPTARCYKRQGNDRRLLVVSKRVEFVARGGRWSPETHRHWGERFKATARALLLSAHASAARSPAAQDSSSEPAACCLGDLPPGVLLHILRLIAHPLACWV